MRTGAFHIVVGTTSSVAVASLFAYFGWLGITVNQMSMDVTEVKTDVKHLSHRVSQIETKMLGSTILPEEIYVKSPSKF